MFAKLKLLVAAAMLLCASAAAVAADYGFDITNETGYMLTHLYVSPETADYWEEDLLGKEGVLRPGRKYRVDLSGYESPIFDIRLVDEDGERYTFWKVDVSKQDLTVTRDDLDD
ncbi:MAG TPA: hypothetical protein VFL30_00005 [Rhodanobacteraceae bacterium]|nr:hypothetical protein [Rhodanobacteraceae bacterium]